MPGPPPKDPKLRQRRNKVATRATLTVPAGDAQLAGRISPTLPKREKGEVPWHEETERFWREVWSSPMAAEFLPADVPGLVLLAKLVDKFNYGDASLASEIRLQRQCFGLTPLDRRRLQWEIERGEAAEKRRVKSGAPKPRRGRDPRSYLRAVK